MPVTQHFTQSVVFGAGHQLAGHERCDRVHGHSYTVQVSWDNVPNRDYYGYPMKREQHLGAIKVVLELESKFLNDMIPAGVPSVSGVAAYLLERLRILDVTKVEVHESDTNATGTSEFIDR